MTAPLEVQMPTPVEKKPAKGPDVMSALTAFVRALESAPPEERAMALGELSTQVQRIIQETYAQVGGAEAGLGPPPGAGPPGAGPMAGPPTAVPTGGGPMAGGPPPMM